MLPTPAQYLLRFDDLCPTVSRTRWQRFSPIVDKLGIKPILAVIPDNKDRRLDRAQPNPEFWAEMRAMEAGGAAIAMHGYRHLCNSPGKSLTPLHMNTEFAGVSGQVQRQWIHAGLSILRDQGLNPRIFVAPRHGLDRNTLWALRKEGIGLISEGFARVPFRRGGVTWIPQQLWEPARKRSGLWTISVHSNTARGSQVEKLQVFLLQNADRFTSVDRVVKEFYAERLGITERLNEKLALWLAKMSRRRKRLESYAGKPDDD